MSWSGIGSRLLLRPRATASCTVCGIDFPRVSGRNIARKPAIKPEDPKIKRGKGSQKFPNRSTVGQSIPPVREHSEPNPNPAALIGVGKFSTVTMYMLVNDNVTQNLPAIASVIFHGPGGMNIAAIQAKPPGSIVPNKVNLLPKMLRLGIARIQAPISTTPMRQNAR